MSHDHDGMTTRAEAVTQVYRRRERALEGQSSERVGLDALAHRTLAEDVVAERDVPSHDVATMDGFAFDATDEYPLDVRAMEVYPEDDPPSLSPGEAVEIATGAPLPPEANAVLKREDVDVDGTTLRGPPLEPGTYTYEQGSNVSAGERLFESGERLSAKDAILLGDLGYETVDVAERFSVGVLATGTEIHEDRSPDLDSPMLANLVRSWGHEATYEGTVPDEDDRVEEAIATLADRYDVVLTTGGTSVGHKDYVIRSLATLGDVQFHRVAVRPGKPIAMATLPDAVAFAIPGKPLGAYTITTLVARPFFTSRSELPSVRATFARDLDLGPSGFEYVVPVEQDGGEAVPLGHVDSSLSVYEETFDPSVLSSSTRATRADGFVVTETALDAGESVDIVPYPTVE